MKKTITLINNSIETAADEITKTLSTMRAEGFIMTNEKSDCHINTNYEVEFKTIFTFEK